MTGLARGTLPGLLALALLWAGPSGCRKNQTFGLEPPSKGDCQRVAALLEQHTRREARTVAELQTRTPPPPGASTTVKPAQYAAAARLIGRMKDHYAWLCRRHTAAAASCMVESQSLDELFACQKQIFMGAPAVASEEMPVAKARQVLAVFQAAAGVPAAERLERLVTSCVDRAECAGSCGPTLRETLRAVSSRSALPASGCPDLKELLAGPAEQAGERLFAWISLRWELLAGQARPALGASQRAALDRAIYGLDAGAGVPLDFRALPDRGRPHAYEVTVPAWAPAAPGSAP